VAGEIARLIGLLDDDSTYVAEDAKAELISMGVEVVEPLVAAVPSLERYGQLSAIEVFEHFSDVRAGPVLIDLLGSEHETVRDWSAWAIAQLGVREAVPALQTAYRRLRVGGGRLDDSEAVAIRHALTVLGARREVVPPLTASLRVPAGSLDHAWPSARLEELINELADYRQAVLYFQLWAVTDRGTSWNGHETLDREFDRDAPWPQMVDAARESALLEVAFIPRRENLFATVEWIDESDR
jgi:HEAT repeat protein